MLESQPLLLLSGTPPGNGNVGEIILRDLVRHLGPRNVCCEAVVGPRYQHRPDAQLAGMRLHLHQTRHIAAPRRGPGKLDALAAEIRFPFGFRSVITALVDKIEHSARSAGAGQVFAVLNNAATMSIAHRIADRLGLPLRCLVWDPPDYVLRQAGFARWSRRWLVGEFERSLARATSVAVVSDSMRRAYSGLTRARVQLLRHGRAAPTCGPPAHFDGWTIGFAGSMYAGCAWSALLKALDATGWRIAGRPVRIRLMTAKATLEGRAGAHIEFLGFRDDAEIDGLLAACDVNYLPQPFLPQLADLCRYAFPTKLAAYLGAGRPVFVHCPAGSALGDYFDSQPFGAICRSLEPGSIVASLEALLGAAESLAAAGTRARELAIREFSENAFHAAIDAVLAA